MTLAKYNLDATDARDIDEAFRIRPANFGDIVIGSGDLRRRSTDDVEDADGDFKRPAKGVKHVKTWKLTLQEFTPTDWLLSAFRSDEANTKYCTITRAFSSPSQASRASPCRTFDPALSSQRYMESTYLVFSPAPRPRKSGPDRTATWQYRPRVGNCPPCMCGSSAFDDPLRSIDEDPAAFVASPTADELLAVVSMLAPPQLQENDDLLSSGSAATDALQAFISGEYLWDIGGSVPSLAVGGPAPPARRRFPTRLLNKHQAYVLTPHGAANAARL
ncbi:hypothetical protein EDB83DRAFT_2325516 [Lactarius deliciosus]|nr:hypothetical protein EDB83DRAFT_2325516 [Lactarius deliciosus]